MLAKKRRSVQQTLASFAGFARKKELSKISPFNDIPSCVLQFYVFSRLSSEDLSKVHSVSKKWKELTTPRSFLPYFLSYQRLKCGSEPLVPRPIFSTSFESLMQFDVSQIAALPSCPLFTSDGCVDFIFESHQAFKWWTRLILSIFMCESPKQLRILMAPFPHGSSLELISFLLSCNLVTPGCFGRFSCRNIYLFDNYLHFLINTPSVAPEACRIPNSTASFFATFKKHVPKKPFTREQRALVETSPRAGCVVLAACFAGCGKTTTLVEYAVARPNMRILYLCFNKSVQLHASTLFPQSNVCCKTLHSLAWESTGSRYRHKLQPSLRLNDLMRVMNITAALASAARTVVLNFLCSCDEDIQAHHSGCMSDGEPLSDEACTLASEIWKKMCDVTDLSLPMLHSGYLKIYASRRPVIETDLIMIDEAQDCDPVRS